LRFLSVSVSHWPHGEEWSSENPNLCHRELRAEENTNQPSAFDGIEWARLVPLEYGFLSAGLCPLCPDCAFVWEGHQCTFSGREDNRLCARLRRSPHKERRESRHRTTSRCPSGPPCCSAAWGVRLRCQ